MNKRTTLLTSLFLMACLCMNLTPSWGKNHDEGTEKKAQTNESTAQKAKPPKKKDDTWLTFGVPVKKPKPHKHKTTIEDRCWDDDNCKFPTLFCLFFDPDNKKGKCKLPTS